MGSFETSYLLSEIWIILQKGGWVMIPIFAVAQAGWIIIFDKAWKLSRFSQRKEEALARSLGAVRHQGEKAMIRKAGEFLAEHIPGLQRHLATLSLLAAAAPLLGLLGTVSGIGETFNVIKRYGAGNPAMLAGGIGEALLTTMAGLITAIPLLFGHTLLSNKADRLENACITGATRLIREYRGEPSGGPA